MFRLPALILPLMLSWSNPARTSGLVTIAKRCEFRLRIAAAQWTYAGLLSPSSGPSEDAYRAETLRKIPPRNLGIITASLIAKAGNGPTLLQHAVRWVPEILILLDQHGEAERTMIEQGFSFFEAALRLGMLRPEGSAPEAWFRSAVSETMSLGIIHAYNRFMRVWPLRDRGRIHFISTAYTHIIGPTSRASAQHQIAAIEGLISLAQRLPVDDPDRLGILDWIKPSRFASATVQNTTTDLLRAAYIL